VRPGAGHASKQRAWNPCWPALVQGAAPPVPAHFRYLCHSVSPLAMMPFGASAVLAYHIVRKTLWPTSLSELALMISPTLHRKGEPATCRPLARTWSIPVPGS